MQCKLPYNSVQLRDGKQFINWFIDDYNACYATQG